MTEQFSYSRQIEDFAGARAILYYNDGRMIDGLSIAYDNFSRENMKAIAIFSETNKELFRMDIVNDKLIYRIRNIIPPHFEEIQQLSLKKFGHMGFTNPKRCFILATDEKIVFIWDSGEIKHFTEWSSIEPYTKPELMGEE